MKAYIDEAMVLHILPKNRAEIVLSQFWEKEYAVHGAKLLKVETTTDLHQKMEKEKKEKM